MSVLDDFKDDLISGKQLAVMPISRLQVESRVEIGNVIVYPPGEVDLPELRTVPGRSLPEANSGDFVLGGQDLREVQTSLTGFNLEVLATHPLAVFPVTIDWSAFLNWSHVEDISLLSRLNAFAEAEMDLVRFAFCRFDLPESLPGRVGSWDDSRAYWGALVFTLQDFESYLVAGEAAHGTVITRGLGLELTESPGHFSIGSGEVAAVAKHGLKMFREVLEAASETDQFIRAMMLLEFLANPDSFSNWKEIKREIAAHVAANPRQYEKILGRFQELTGKKDSLGNECGYRTLVVHHGKSLDEIVRNRKDRRSLFMELQGYASRLLKDMLAHQSQTWEELLDYRKQRREQIGVS